MVYCVIYMYVTGSGDQHMLYDIQKIVISRCRPLLQVVVTNTVPHDVQKMQCHKIRTVDISAMLSEAIRRIHNQESMSHLFQHISMED